MGKEGRKEGGNGMDEDEDDGGGRGWFGDGL